MVWAQDHQDLHPGVAGEDPPPGCTTSRAQANGHLPLFAGRPESVAGALAVDAFSFFSESAGMGLGWVSSSLAAPFPPLGLGLGCVCSLALVSAWVAAASLSLFTGKLPDLVKYLSCAEFRVQLVWIGFSVLINISAISADSTPTSENIYLAQKYIGSDFWHFFKN